MPKHECPLDHINTAWRHCEKCGGCWDTSFITDCPCGDECKNCRCPLEEHFEPDATMLAEHGIDMEEAYCAGKLNTCGMCGECYQ